MTSLPQLTQRWAEWRVGNLHNTQVMTTCETTPPALVECTTGQKQQSRTLLEISRHMLCRQALQPSSATTRPKHVSLDSCAITGVRVCEVNQINLSTPLRLLRLLPSPAASHAAQPGRRLLHNYFTSRDHHPRQRSPPLQLVPLPTLRAPPRRPQSTTPPPSLPRPPLLHCLKTPESSWETRTPWGCPRHPPPMHRRSPHPNPRPPLSSSHGCPTRRRRLPLLLLLLNRNRNRNPSRRRRLPRPRKGYPSACGRRSARGETAARPAPEQRGTKCCFFKTQGKNTQASWSDRACGSFTASASTSDWHDRARQPV